MVGGRRLFLLLLLQIPCQGHCESVTCYHQYQYPQLNVGKHEVPVPKCQLGDGPVLGGGGGPHLCLQSPGLTAQQMTMYVAVGQSSGASQTMFLSPSSGQPSFLPMVARRLGWEQALPILPGPSWAGSKARDETATSWEEPHRFRRRSLGHFCSRSSPSQAIF